VPQHRIDLGYDIEHFYDPRTKLPGRVSLPRAGFVDHPELFDPIAFGLSPRDAISMETQQRLMVEVTWDALEDAGIPPDSLQGERVAVLIGHMAEDYTREQIAVQGEDAFQRGLDVFVVGGMSRAVASGRISFLLGVTGPSFTLDTACSSSLFTTHLACQSIWSGESEMAIAGGVNVFLTPEGNIALSRSGMLSMDGNCKAFDASADGFVRAEGAGMVVLRPLQDALAANDRIYSVIRGTGISADGRDGGHMMAPGRSGQAQAMRDAYARSGVDPSEIHYVETHGTGTVIGDPVELKALGDVMGPGRPADRPLLVASVKGTLGHAESASGIAGLIKASLSVHHRELPPQLHFKEPSPHIPWDELPIRVQTEHTAWPYEGPARAGVNSFGISGTNAHVVLESAPEREAPPSSNDGKPYLLPISGHTPRALEQMAGRYRDWLRAEVPPSLRDVAYTLGLRRSHRGQRLCVVGHSHEELVAELDACLESGDAPGRIRGTADAGRVPGVAFVFPGQGSQWAGMGRQLLEDEPVFRASIEAWDTAFARHVEWSLLDVLKTGDDALLERLDIVQPVLIAFSAALADLWTSFGVRPAMVIGQSLGEVAAAHIAGHLPREEAARLACERGAQVARASGQGGMGIVGLPAEEVQSELDGASNRWQGRVEVAGVNSPRNTIVSGDRDAVEALLAVFVEREVFARPLNVDFASHCFHMEPLLEGFAQAIGNISPVEGGVPCYSTVTGERIEGSALTQDYWLRNLRSPVQLASAVTLAIADGAEVFIEMSPHPALSQSVREVAEAAGTPIHTLAPLRRDQDEARSLRCALGEAFVRGVELDFGALHGEGQLVPAPLYAYQRELYWFGRRRRKHLRRRTHPLLGVPIQSSTDPSQRIYESTLDPDVVPYLADATLGGSAHLTPALFIEAALAVAANRTKGEVLALRDLDLPGVCPLPDDEIVVLQAVLRESHARSELHVAGRATHPEAEWTPLLHGSIEGVEKAPASESLDALKSACPERADARELYQEVESSGLGLARSLRTIRELWLGDGQALAQVSLHHSVATESALYHAHPALLTGCLQVVSAALSHEGAPGALMLNHIDALEFDTELGPELWCHASLRGDSGLHEGDVVADITLLDAEGSCRGHVTGLRGRRLAPETHSTAAPVYELGWKPLPELSLDPDAPARWLIVSDREDEGAAIASALAALGARAEVRAPLELAGEDLHGAGIAFVSGAPEPSPKGDDPLEAAFERAAACEGVARIAVVTRLLHAVANEPSSPRRSDARRSARADALARSEAPPPCLRIDVERDSAADAIARALLGPAREDRVALRGSALFGARLLESAAIASEADPRLVQANTQPFEARLVPAGDLEPVALFEATRTAPGPGEVRIEVRAAALSFLDLVASFDPSGVLGLGRECAGVITEVGPGVANLRVGDEVFGFCEGAAASELVARAELLVAKPADLSFERAAGLPLAFATAELALDAARVREGERVLIHSASSAIGLASLQLARARGAEIFATAGSPERREALEAMGISHVASSRSLDFADAIKVWTDGRGVDVVLDALTTNSARESAALLAPGGRMVALSRPDPSNPRALDLRDLEQGRTYASIDLSRMLDEAPDAVSALLREVAHALCEGRVEALPTTSFALEHAGRALRFMAQDRHIGKVVLKVVDPEQVEVRALERSAEDLALEGTVLVAGPNLGEQVLVAGWLARHGAREIHLMSADLPDARCIDALRAIEEQGVGVRVAEKQPEGPLAGVVVVAAGSVQPDAPLAAADFEAGIAADLDATYGGNDLTFFAMLAPADALLGIPGERGSSHSVFDSIASERRSHGLHAASLAIVPGGNANGRRFADACMQLVREPRNALVAPSGLLAVALQPDASLFQELDLAQAGQRSGLRDELLALGADERRERMIASVVEAVAAVLSLSASARDGLDLHLPLNRLGIDSLMGLELRIGLERDLALEIPPTFFVEEPSVNDVAELLLGRIEAGEKTGT
jgi:acyl transferase domain-containing protein/NADPH-dependent curcumin reductase CurA/acyl carrier protein